MMILLQTGAVTLLEILAPSFQFSNHDISEDFDAVPLRDFGAMTLFEILIP